MRSNSFVTLAFCAYLASATGLKAAGANELSSIPCTDAYRVLGSASDPEALADYKNWNSLFPGQPFSQILDKAESGAMPRAQALAALLNEAETKFRKAGIAYQRVAGPNGSDRLLITPANKGHRAEAPLLNKLALGLKKYGPETELVYDPEQIAFGTAGIRAMAALTGKKISVVMSHLAAQQADAAEGYLVHEIIHAKNFADELRDKTNAFQIKAVAMKPSGFSLGTREGKLPPLNAIFRGQYDQFMKLDELITFRHNLKKNLHGLLDQLDTDGAELNFHARELAAHFQANAAVGSRAEGMGTLAKHALEEFERKGLDTLGSSVSFKIGDITYKAGLKKAADGAPVLTIEESAGLLNRKKELISFALAFPGRANRDSEKVALDALFSRVEIMQAAGSENITLAMKVLPLIEAFELGSIPKPDEKPALKKALLEALNSINFPKGYVERKTP